MDLENLKKQAITIRDENERSANTASRVGRAMLETVNAIEENNTAIAANAANIKTNATDISTHAADIAKIQVFYHGDLGNFASWTEATAALDAMVTDPKDNGQYQIRIGSVPFIVNFACLSTGSKIYTQSVIGAAALKSDGTLVTTHGQAVNIFSRSYADSAWGAWTRLAAMSDVPTVQTACAGTNKNYIYQDVKDSTKYVLSGVGKAYQYNTKLRISYKLWGSGNTAYDDGMYKNIEVPVVTSGADGAMNHNVYGRITNNTLSEVGSTTEAVKINYTNYANGGARTLTISKATTAKAGAMTAEHVKELNSLSTHIQDLGDYASEIEALTRIGQLDVCSNKKLVHAHLTYATDNASTRNTLILIQSIEGKQCRQFIFNKTKAFSRLIHFTDETLTSQEFTEDWTFMFADRLEWSADHHGYLMSQNGVAYGKDYSDPIPTASATADGLMSKEDYALLQKIKTQLNL